LAYEVVWHEGVLKDLKCLDRRDARRIVERVKDYLAGDPESLGKPFKGTFMGLYRYRYGIYRVIYALDRAERKLVVLHVRPRAEAYRK
jgi:mRNA interferase RelE/StbE